MRCGHECRLFALIRPQNCGRRGQIRRIALVAAWCIAIESGLNWQGGLLRFRDSADRNAMRRFLCPRLGRGTPRCSREKQNRNQTKQKARRPSAIGSSCGFPS